MLPVKRDFYFCVMTNLSSGMHLLLKNDKQVIKKNIKMQEDVGIVYLTVLCGHPYLVSLLFAILLSLHF